MSPSQRFLFRFTQGRLGGTVVCYWREGWVCLTVYVYGPSEAEHGLRHPKHQQQRCSGLVRLSYRIESFSLTMSLY